MSDYKDVFRNKGSQNWCKLWTGVYILRDGIIDFVKDEIESFQRQLLRTLPVGPYCGACATHNVLLCPTPTICRLRHGQCNYHNTPACVYTPCTTHDKIRDAISNEHRFHSPSWLNSHAENWTTSSWEIAKCFMPKDGYLDKPTADETDLNGILAVIINCKRFQNVFAASISSKTNICVQVRDIINKVRHFEQMQVNIADVDLVTYLDTFIDLLDDAKALHAHSKSTDARLKLAKLKADKLSITTVDAKHVLDDAIGEIDKIKDSYEQSVKSTEQKAIKDVERLLKRHRQIANGLERKIRTTIRNTFARGHLAFRKTVRKEQERFEQIASTTTQQVDYETTKNELKRDLVEFYKVRRSTMPLSPLLQVRDAALTDFYVDPIIKRLTDSNVSPKKQIRSYRNMFRDGEKNVRNIYVQGEPGTGKSSFCSKLTLDWCGIIENNTNVYQSTTCSTQVTSAHTVDAPSHKQVETQISSEATTSAQPLAQEPVHELKSSKSLEKQSPSASTSIGTSYALTKADFAFLTPICKDIFSLNRKPSLYEDKEELKRFNFVFHVSLRDANGIDCAIDDMIQHQIISELSGAHNYTSSFVASVMSKERCLVILDGLDEWIHMDGQNSVCKRPPSSRSIPHRKVRNDCVLLTTARPWKMAEVQIKDSDIDIALELTGVSDTEALVHKALTCMNSKFSKQKKSGLFMSEVRDKKLEHFLSIPVIALQLLCLWYHERPFGHSRCEIYSNMIDMLLQVIDGKYPDCPSLPGNTDEPIGNAEHKPRCFENNSYCTKLYSLLVSLGELAYHTLVSRNRESTLVFSEGIMTTHLSKTERQIALDSGILSLHKSTQGLLPGQARCSFLHKTFQEFLAAFHISINAGITSGSLSLLFEKHGHHNITIQNEEVFTFVCGMNKRQAENISEILMGSIANTVHDGCSLCQKNCQNNKKMVHTLVIRGYEESNDNKIENINLALRCAVFDDDNKWWHPVINKMIDEDKNKRNIKSLCIDISDDLMFDLASFPFKHLQEIEIGGNFWKYDKCIDLSESNDLRNMSIGEGFIAYENAMMCTFKLNTSKLEYCTLFDLNIPATEHVLTAVQANTKTMRKLDLRQCVLPTWFADSFFPGCLNLTFLSIVYRSNTDQHKYSKRDLERARQNLLKLSIYSDSRERDTKLNTTSLETVYMDRVFYSVEQIILNGLAAGAPKLKTINISHCEDSALLCQVFPKLPNVLSLTIKNTNICGDLQLATMTKLQNLALHFTILGESTVITLPDAIKTIDLDNVDLSNEQFKQIMQRIEHFGHGVGVDISPDKETCVRLADSMVEFSTFVEDLTQRRCNGRVFQTACKQKVIIFEWSLWGRRPMLELPKREMDIEILGPIKL